MARMSPQDRRRDAIVDAALAVAVRKGLAADDRPRRRRRDGHVERPHPPLLRLDGRGPRRGVRAGRGPGARRDRGDARRGRRPGRGPDRRSSDSYAPVDEDWSFQLWLDAWAEAARRPALREASSRLNLAWAGLLEEAIRDGVAAGCSGAQIPRAPRGGSCRSSTASRSRSSPTGRSWIAHMLSWAATAAERELGLSAGTLKIGATNGATPPRA